MKNLKIEIVQEFKGLINDIEIKEKDVFYTVGYLIDELDQAGINYNNEIIDYLNGTIQDIKDHVQNFSMQELEQDFTSGLKIDGTLGSFLYKEECEDVNELINELNQGIKKWLNYLINQSNYIT